MDSFSRPRACPSAQQQLPGTSTGSMWQLEGSPAVGDEVGRHGRSVYRLAALDKGWHGGLEQ